LGCPPGGRGSPTSAEPRRAWGRPRGGSGGWGGGGTLPGSILGTQPAICRNPVSLLTREPPNTPQFLQIEAQRLLGPLRGTFLSVIWSPAERLARRRTNASDILRLCAASTGGCTAFWDQKLRGWRCGCSWQVEQGCSHSHQDVKRLPARVNKIGKIESRGKVLKLSDKSNKLNLTRPFTAREKNRLVI
jgi:hypothetical protein